MKLLFFQTGDYAEAYTRFSAGLPETYRDQKASVEYVAGLAARYDVTTLALCETVHDTELAPQLRALGRRRADFDAAQAAALLTELAPDIVIARAPFVPVLRHAQRHSLPTLPCFADLFQNRTGLRGLRDRWRHAELRRLLSGAHIPCVANHSLNASRSVVTGLGVPAARVVPWDWARIAPTPKARDGWADAAAPTAFFAGALSTSKGVGDCLHAVRLLRDQGISLRLSLAGGGDTAPWRAEADRLGITDQVTFLGLIPNTDVRQKMQAHDMVLVPSRHSYPEGLPNTIYEGLASRSALVISDHPAFAGRMTADLGCVVFRAGDPADLAHSIARLGRDAALYARLSEQAPQTLEGLYLGMVWAELVDTFLEDPGNTRDWVARAALPVWEA